MKYLNEDIISGLLYVVGLLQMWDTGVKALFLVSNQYRAAQFMFATAILSAIFVASYSYIFPQEA